MPSRVAPDGTAYVAGPNGIFHLNATGTALLSSSRRSSGLAAMTVAQDGSLYLAGSPINSPQPFQTTPGAFEPAPAGTGALPGQVGLLPASAVARMNGSLSTVLAATYFGSPYWK